jgi:hypothetical protein
MRTTRTGTFLAPASLVEEVMTSLAVALADDASPRTPIPTACRDRTAAPGPADLGRPTCAASTPRVDRARPFLRQSIQAQTGTAGGSHPPRSGDMQPGRWRNLSSDLRCGPRSGLGAQSSRAVAVLEHAAAACAVCAEGTDHLAGCRPSSLPGASGVGPKIALGLGMIWPQEARCV